jgi:hypothetical protein
MVFHTLRSSHKNSDLKYCIIKRDDRFWHEIDKFEIENHLEQLFM